MAKASKSKKRAGSAPKVDPYLEGLMAKLLERLVNLERKIDTVISRTGTKPAAPSGAPSAPQQSVPSQQQSQQRRERMLYEAICADCSKVCEVPFKPSETRPVYCKPCFAKRKSALMDNKFGGVIIKPVALPPRPADKPLPAALSSPQAPAPARTAKKSAKSKPAKKAKKKK